jgi:hypothetical protein
MRRIMPVLVVVCASFVPALAYAQASITGVATDTSGGVLPGVTVEAASTALIEGVRATVTDGTGQYRIVELRPGTYTVTFTLPGFSRVVREGLTLEGLFTATVDAEMRVGSLEESITVAAETPVVDVQSVRRQTTISGEVVDAIPSARAYGALMQMIPTLTTQVGFTPGGQDVQVTPGMTVFGGVGGRVNEGRLEVDGMSVGASVNGGGVSGYIADVVNSEEVVFTTTGGLGEAQVGGPVMSIIPKTGGNRFSGSVFVAGFSEGMVGDNFTPELQAQGLSVGGRTLKLWDFSGAAGGPIVRDRAWFFGNFRDEGAYTSVPGMFANLNAGDPTKWTYAPDTGRQARDANSQTISNLRLTLQMTPRNKVGVFWDHQIPCGGATWTPDADGCRQNPGPGADYIYGGGATASPETSGYAHKWTNVQQATWTSPVTNRFLLDAGFGTYLTRYGSRERPGNPTRDLIRVTRVAPSFLQFRSQDYQDRWIGTHTWRGSASYVTGAQSLKVGYQGGYLVYTTRDSMNTQNLTYTLSGSRPISLTQSLLPFERSDRLRYDAFYVQEQWTLDRLTLQGAVRYDHAESWFPPASVGPTRFLPERVSFPRTEGVAGFSDLTPRVGVAYDLTGDGKTSVKVNLGRYLEAAALLGIYSSQNPVTRMDTSEGRSWNDGNGNYVADCDLLNPGAQNNLAGGGDLCGALGNQAFGQPVLSSSTDPKVLGGWGTRPGDWGFGVSVQRELLPRVSLEIGYNRRWLQNFILTDNLAVSASDFDEFSLTVPVDPRLPGGGGYVVSGLYNVKGASFGRVDNYTTAARDYGRQSQVYDGMQLSLSGRAQGGLTFQVGLNTGKTVFDNCEIRETLREVASTGGLESTIAYGPNNPYCHQDPGFITRLTGLATYVVPKIDVLLSATMRSDQGVSLNANWDVPNAVVRGFLGRDLSGNQTQLNNVNIVAPGQVWGDRVNEINVRIAKILRVGGARTTVGFEIFNVMNANPVLTYNQDYFPTGNWLTPTRVLTPRFAKFSARVDF